MAFLGADEMAEADRIAINDYGIDVMSLMENAGVAVSRVARLMLGGVPHKKVVCLVGKGNNGGDGLVAARHLSNWGADVTVLLGSQRMDMRDNTSRQLAILEKMGIHVEGPDGDIDTPQLIVDALLGYNSKGNPREPVAELIRKANSSRMPILAVDLPSGLDSTTGSIGSPCIVARATVTLAFPKIGFLADDARKMVGDLYLADISFPEGIYRKFGQASSPFATDTFVQVW